MQSWGERKRETRGPPLPPVEYTRRNVRVLGSIRAEAEVRRSRAPLPLHRSGIKPRNGYAYIGFNSKP